VSRRLAAVVLAIAATAAAGCSRHASRLSGQVSLDGQPLTTGVITLTPVAAGPSAYAAIGPDGRYAIHTGAATGLEPGEYVVTVAANAAGSGKAAGVEQPGGKGLPSLITPAEYLDRARSPLRVMVIPGTQVVDFNLESKFGKKKK
jgi:hypothetical protein